MNEYTEKTISCDLEFRVNVNSEKEVKTFLSDLNSSTCCSFIIQSGRQDRRPKGDKARSSLRGYRKCCLNVSHSEGKESRQPGKITDCQASINFRLENPVGEFKMIKDERSEFPLWVKITYHHNHHINRAEYFKYLDVSLDTKNTYSSEMFTQGFSPSAAHREEETDKKKFR